MMVVIEVLPLRFVSVIATGQDDALAADESAVSVVVILGVGREVKEGAMSGGVLLGVLLIDCTSFAASAVGTGSTSEVVMRVVLPSA